jgi:hypothetical protein
MKDSRKYIIEFLFFAGVLFLAAVYSFGQEKKESSYSPVIEEPFERVMTGINIKRLW